MSSISKFTASSFHLGLSLLVLTLPIGLIRFVWYPDFFFAIDGGFEGASLMIAVSLIIGPLLTLIIFKPGKPGLTFDLICIGVAQSLCLIASTYIVYIERPLFFIYYDGQFYSANADSYGRFDRNVPDPSKYGTTLPAIVISTVPDNAIMKADYLKLLFQDGLPNWVYEKSYEPLVSGEILADGYSQESIKERGHAHTLEAWLTTYGGAIEDYAFYPVRARFGDPLLGIRRENNEIVDILNTSSSPGF